MDKSRFEVYADLEGHKTPDGRTIPASLPHVTAFEVGARGVVTKDNSDRLKALHKFCQKKIKYKQFLQNILALAVNASYYLWICRKDPVWSDPPLLTTPFSTHQ